MVGFDIGGTKCAVCVGIQERNGLKIVGKQKIETDLSVSPYVMLERLCHLAEQLTDDLSSIGISCGNPLDCQHGIILSPPNLPGWDHVRIVDYLKERYHGSVSLENDANACALAEWKFGAGRGCNNMIFLTFGTGMGAGLILNGQLYRGKSGNAGEIGHIRMQPFGPVGYGKMGSFEGFASGGGIAQLARSAALELLQAGKATTYCQSIEELPFITAEKVAHAARAADPTAQRIYRICGEMLGQELAAMIDLLNPERIVLGSIFERAGDLLEESMWDVLKREALVASLQDVQILPAELGEFLGDYAALTVACD